MAAEELSFDFITNRLDSVPVGFKNTLGGQGKPGDWRIIEAEVPSLFPPLPNTAPATVRKPVLAQLARDGMDEHFPMFLYEGQDFGDFKVSTRFRLEDGDVERMAGIAFRVQDERNYYYVRASATTGSFSFYKIQNGQRSAPIGGQTNIAAKTWHEMTVQCLGSEIRATLNGSELFPALTDNTFASGQIGFWTMADSVSYFTDTRIIFEPRLSLAQTLISEAIGQYPRLIGLKIVATHPETGVLSIVASDEASELGSEGMAEERDVIAHNSPYYLRNGKEVTVVLPLHDRNGDVIAALRVVLKRFTGQTEKNALARAMPIAKKMEPRILSKKELLR